MELKLFYKVVQSLATPGVLEECLLKKALKTAKTEKNPAANKQLVSSEKFISSCRRLLDKGDRDWVVALHILLACGRRRRDLSRIEPDNVSKLSATSYFVSVPRDKKNAGRVTFIIDFTLIPNGWSVLEADELACSFDDIVQSQTSGPFRFLQSSSASRHIGFGSHSLRNIKTIQLTLEGKTEQQIQDYVGWRDSRSVSRYRILTKEEVCRFGSLEEVIQRVNGLVV